MQPWVEPHRSAPAPRSTPNSSLPCTHSPPVPRAWGKVGLVQLPPVTPSISNPGTGGRAAGGHCSGSLAGLRWGPGGQYLSITEQNCRSYPSNPVKIIVAGEGPGSACRLPAPHPARPTGDLCTDGTLRARLCPWAQQRGRPAREQGWSHWGVLQPGELGICGRGRGIPAPRGAAEQGGPFPGNTSVRG